MDNRPLKPEGSGRWEFVGRTIKVAVDGEMRQPVSIVIDNTEYRISEILVSWFDWGFAAGAKQRDWKTRRHRRYFRVSTETGEIFEIYQDRRGVSDRTGEWVCYQRWIPGSRE